MIRIALWLLTATSLSAQFTSLSTTIDGSQLYFTTDLRQAGAGQPAYGKAFVADASGVRPLLIRNRDLTFMDPFNFQPDGYRTNYYDLTSISAAGNVSALAVSGFRYCEIIDGRYCAFQNETTVYNSRGEIAFEGNGIVALSRNGKWGLSTVIRVADPGVRVTLIELATGNTYFADSGLTMSPDWRSHGVADDGTAVMANRRNVVVFRPPNLRETIPAEPQTVNSAVISASGGTVVWEQSSSTVHGIRIASLQGTKTPVSLDLPGRSDSAPRISDDGSRILFLSTPLDRDDPQVFIVRPDGTMRRQITNDVDGIAEAVLSGNGRVAWVVTRTGRLLQLDLEAGTNRQMIGPVAAFLRAPRYTGVRIESFVRSVAEETVTIPASVMPGEQVDLRIDGKPAEAVQGGKQSVSFQAPWAPVDKEFEVTLSKPGDVSWSPASVQMRITGVKPRFLTSAEGYAMVHENFAGWVTSLSPPRPGEVVHVFGTGFGPVDPPAPRNSPAPASPLSRLINPLTCTVNWGLTTVDVLFAGLAPGTTGYYQLDLRLPASIAVDPRSLHCSIP